MFNRYLRVLATLLALLVAVMASVCALAENGPAMVLPPDGVDQSEFQFFPYQSDQAVINLKSILYEYGYYSKAINSNDSSLSSTVYDDLAMAAVQECCRANGFQDSPYGLLVETYAKIINRSFKPSPDIVDSSQPHHIPWGEASPTVSSIQYVLVNLGYMDNYEMDSATGVPKYGPAMRDGLEDFFKNNGVPDYDQATAGEGEYQGKGGLTPSIQAFILGNDTLKPKPTPNPSDSPSPSPSVDPNEGKNYWARNAKILGMNMPNWLVWAIGAVLLAIIVIAAMRLFGIGPFGDGDSDENGNRNSVISRPIKFNISYKGAAEDYTCVITKILRIGRNVGTFPLNLEDMSISRRHCEIYYLNNQLMLRDYSANGTIVNNQVVHNSECRLNSGDRLQIGGHYITVTY